MKSLVVKCPINPLSFGNVSYNLLRELFKRGINVSLFPVGDKLDLTAYDKLDESFKSWLEKSAANRLRTVKRDIPQLQLWHINGSEGKMTDNSSLLTFYELDSPTEAEVNLVNLQDHTFFSSKYSHDSFKALGCENISHIPMGFDEDYCKKDNTYLEGRVHFGLMGKFEKRKHTAKIIQTWVNKYGNQFDYQLTCCVTNPFFKPEQMNQFIAQTLEGKRYGNVNFLPYLRTNSEVNDLLNSIDIDLTGLSGAEGWNLPSFNATCLGKWSIVLNATSHKDWATKDNCILIEPCGTESAVDGMFFQNGGDFNQGNIYNLDEKSILSGIEKAILKVGTVNEEGIKMSKKLTYSNTMDKILNQIGV